MEHHDAERSTATAFARARARARRLWCRPIPSSSEGSQVYTYHCFSSHTFTHQARQEFFTLCQVTSGWCCISVGGDELAVPGEED